jgi:hypothetical protein
MQETELSGSMAFLNDEAVTLGAEATIETTKPYTVKVKLKGTSALLFHKWDDEDVAAKGAAAKGSKAKKMDNLEAYVYKTDTGEIALPGEYVRMAIVNAAKFRQDPRSPRKSAMDLYKAAVVPLTELASLGTKEWDYVDRRRVKIQMNAVTRERPAFRSGWEAEFYFQVLLPEYVTPQDLLDVLTNAGKVVGVGNFRPTFGRFQVVHFEVVE